MNNLTLAGTMFTSPSAAFAELRERPRFWLVLLVVLASAAGLQYWYFQTVDIEWLKDHLYSGNAQIQAMPEDARARMNASMTANTMSIGSLVAIIIFVPAMIALQAAYLLLAGKIVNVQKSYKHWFALLSWSSLPVLLGVVASAVVLLMAGSNAQLSPSALQLLSINELVLQLKPNDSGYQLASTLGLLSMWTWALGIIGVRTWSGKSWTFSAIFYLLPLVVVYGVWAAIAFS